MFSKKDDNVTDSCSCYSMVNSVYINKRTQNPSEPLGTEILQTLFFRRQFESGTASQQMLRNVRLWTLLYGFFSCNSSHNYLQPLQFRTLSICVTLYFLLSVLLLFLFNCIYTRSTVLSFCNGLRMLEVLRMWFEF